ncbi:hypothetical protein PGT21_023459 [Puccinia graminis f. sp. tritici]|uniref:Uncharacterized protein n=1 Tax=Puccinia graminis f. sp. tritici TaxID=56615 RepID=A0A5B0P692_PUCGR|nr:hypothetical protein PGT21_023459 [Puccinia graminis f. sp. tritici]KAA1131802.1 hypothetical protein PGTUg99_026332 [Puccinia graminis f. sp. tritici]
MIDQPIEPTTPKSVVVSFPEPNCAQLKAAVQQNALTGEAEARRIALIGQINMAYYDIVRQKIDRLGKKKELDKNKGTGATWTSGSTDMAIIRV